MRNVITRTLIGGLALAAAGAPAAAQARPIRDQPARHAPASHPAAVAQSSFPWIDAGIGAAGGMALLAAGAAVAGTRRRTVERAS